jgi:hypothetical protein
MQVSVVDAILLGSVSSLADSGVNVYVTNDPSLLINIVEINLLRSTLSLLAWLLPHLMLPLTQPPCVPTRVFS